MEFHSLGANSLTDNGGRVLKKKINATSANAASGVSIWRDIENVFMLFLSICLRLTALLSNGVRGKSLHRLCGLCCARHSVCPDKTFPTSTPF